MDRDRRELKRRLDALYRRFARTDRIGRDPVEFPHRYHLPRDIETAALISSSLSYGRVDLFKPVISRILDCLGAHPHRALLGFDAVSVRKTLQSVGYRFNSPKDIAAYLVLLSQALSSHGSLKKIFFDEPGGARERLSHMVHVISAGDTSSVYGRNEMPYGLRQMLPDTGRGGASKRMYMFLRWMVRRDEVDFGLWSEFGAGNLIIPLDTHVARLSRLVGLTRRKSTDYRTAAEVTESLRELDPDDPVKYDFALAHMGISGECPPKPDEARCASCGLTGVCGGGKGDGNAVFQS